MRTAIFPARFDKLDDIRAFASQAARDAGMDDSETYAIELAVDEACTNIIEHAYQGEDHGDIECTCDCNDTCLTVVIRDHGKPFDPSTVTTPDLDADIDDRPVGGLGIYLMKQLMDEVHFEPMGESGNILTLIKRRKSGKKNSPSRIHDLPGRQIIQLGDELLKGGSLESRRDLILETATLLLNAQVELWLDENQFRLPGLNQPPLFPVQPPDGPMLETFRTGNPYLSKRPETLLAFPIKNGLVCMGVLQAQRPGKPFRKNEIEIMEWLTGHVSLALVAAHRLAVDQWRTERLTLVRRVSAQIANVLDLNVLARRVTKLIQRTFNYYYVAIFTHTSSQEFLNFRSSAGQARARKTIENTPWGWPGWFCSSDRRRSRYE